MWQCFAEQYTCNAQCKFLNCHGEQGLVLETTSQRPNICLARADTRPCMIEQPMRGIGGVSALRGEVAFRYGKCAQRHWGINFPKNHCRPSKRTEWLPSGTIISRWYQPPDSLNNPTGSWRVDRRRASSNRRRKTSDEYKCFANNRTINQRSIREQ